MKTIARVAPVACRNQTTCVNQQPTDCYQREEVQVQEEQEEQGKDEDDYGKEEQQEEREEAKRYCFHIDGQDNQSNNTLLLSCNNNNNTSEYFKRINRPQPSNKPTDQEDDGDDIDDVGDDSKIDLVIGGELNSYYSDYSQTDHLSSTTSSSVGSDGRQHYCNRSSSSSSYKQATGGERNSSLPHQYRLQHHHNHHNHYKHHHHRHYHRHKANNSQLSSDPTIDQSISSYAKASIGQCHLSNQLLSTNKNLVPFDANSLPMSPKNQHHHSQFTVNPSSSVNNGFHHQLNWLNQSANQLNLNASNNNQQRSYNDGHHSEWLDNCWPSFPYEDLQALTNYKHPVGELRLAAKLVNATTKSSQSRSQCHCSSCIKYSTTTTTSATIKSNNYFDLSPDGSYLMMENPFKIKQQQQQQQQYHRSHHRHRQNHQIQQQLPCNRFKYSTIIDCRDPKPLATTVASAKKMSLTAANQQQQQQLQSTKFDLIIKSLIKSFIMQGNDACIVSIGKDSGQTQSTMFGATPPSPMANYLTEASDCINRCQTNDIIDAIVPKSIIYCYQLLDRLRLQVAAASTGTLISYRLSLKCILIIMPAKPKKVQSADGHNKSSNNKPPTLVSEPDGDGQYNTTGVTNQQRVNEDDEDGTTTDRLAIYDLLKEGHGDDDRHLDNYHDLEMDHHQSIGLESFIKQQEQQQRKTSDLLYRELESKQTERQCDQVEDYMEILQLVWHRYSEICMHSSTEQPMFPNLVMQLNLTAATTGNRKQSVQPIHTNHSLSSRFCLLDLHPNVINLDKLNNFMPVLNSSRESSSAELSIDGIRDSSTASLTTTLQNHLMDSILRAHLNGALTKSLLLVHLNDCQMAHHENVSLARFGLHLHQASILRIQRRKYLIRMQQHKFNTRASAGGLTYRDRNNNHVIYCIDHNDKATDDDDSESGNLNQPVVADYCSSRSSIDTVIQTHELNRIKTQRSLTNKIDLNALLLSPRRLPFFRRASGSSESKAAAPTTTKQDRNRSWRIGAQHQTKMAIRSSLESNSLPSVNNGTRPIKLYQIDCLRPQELSKRQSQRSISQLADSISDLVDYVESDDPDDSLARADSPPFPLPPTEDCYDDGEGFLTEQSQQNHYEDSITGYIIPISTVIGDRKAENRIEVDAQSQSDFMSDVVAEPPKQLKLEEFLQQLTTVMAPANGRISGHLAEIPAIETNDGTKLLGQINKNKINGSCNSLSHIPLPPMATVSNYDDRNNNNTNDEDDCCSHSSIMNHLSSITNQTLDDDDSDNRGGHFKQGEITIDHHQQQDNNNNSKLHLYSRVNKPIRSPSSCEGDHQSNKANSTSSGCSSSAGNSDPTKSCPLSFGSESHHQHNEKLNVSGKQASETKGHRRQKSISTNNKLMMQQHQQLDFHQQTSSGYTSSCNTSVANCNSTGDLQQIINATRMLTTAKRSILTDSSFDHQQAIIKDGSMEIHDDVYGSRENNRNNKGNVMRTHKDDLILSPDHDITTSSPSSSDHSVSNDEANDENNYGSIKRSTCSLLCCRFPSVLVGIGKTSRH